MPAKIVKMRHESLPACSRPIPLARSASRGHESRGVHLQKLPEGQAVAVVQVGIMHLLATSITSESQLYFSLTSTERGSSLHGVCVCSSSA